MALKNEILNWDGKSVHDITIVYEKHCLSTGFVNKLVKYCAILELQKGASWLLKRYCENNGIITDNQIEEIYSLLPKFLHWEAKLHTLQIIPYLKIPVIAQKDVECFLRSGLEQSEKFVRAWSYNGFYELALQYPEYQEEVKQFFEMALRDDSASVKARIRYIMKKGF